MRSDAWWAAGKRQRRGADEKSRETLAANLLLAAKRAAAGKRSRPDVAWFLLNLEWELMRLQRALREGSYQPGRYRTFGSASPNRGSFRRLRSGTGSSIMR